MLKTLKINDPRMKKKYKSKKGGKRASPGNGYLFLL